MQSGEAKLRPDGPSYPPFVMGEPSSPELRERVAEWVLATWLKRIDPNILGVRCVDEGKNGDVLPILHIAIPLGYRRKQLALMLENKQIENEQSTPRVNLVSSDGSDGPHCYIRVPAEEILNELFKSIKDSLFDVGEINNHTIQAPQNALEEFARASQKQRDHEENGRMRSAVYQALTMRNLAIDPDQVQILLNKKDGERWIRIKDVDRGLRTTLKLAIKQAGVNSVSTPRDGGDDSDWAVLFPANEAKKLLSDY